MGNTIPPRRDTRKDTNPKDASGERKAPFAPLPPRVMAEVGVAMLEGELKYGRYNWREGGAKASVYYNALMRHIVAWWEGQDYDPDSGLHHLSKLMATAAVLRDSMLHGKFSDDRPPSIDPAFWEELNVLADALRTAYPDPVDPVTQADLARRSK